MPHGVAENSHASPDQFCENITPGCERLPAQQLKSMFRESVETVFQNPKPVRLIQRIVELSTSEGDLVLDSFAGSGTTAEAVLRSRDRQFVIVQQAFDSKEEELAKRNICREVVYRRVHTVAKEVDETFTYAQVGSTLFGEYKDFGEELPPYEDIAKYIFYTETSREFPGATTKANSAWNKKSAVSVNIPDAPTICFTRRTKAKTSVSIAGS